ncbi:MAG: RidA family protein [Deltaproteobacteria bacterium]|nr:RidA family protein [Deltaproteobacteria bacterium]
MAYNIIQTDKAPAATGPYSQGILVDQWLFVSGQIGLIPTTGELKNNNFSDEVNQTLSNMWQILKEADLDIRDIVSVDVYLTDINNFSRFNEIYSLFMGEVKPARAVVEVSALPRGAEVEIKCIAHKNGNY